MEKLTIKSNQYEAIGYNQKLVHPQHDLFQKQKHGESRISYEA